jgi:cell division protein FtsB
MKKNKKYRTKIKNRVYILLILLVGGITYLVYTDFGLKKLIAIKREKNNFQTQIQSLLNQQISIQNEITKLKIDTLYIEQLAREKFLMVKPGEKVFKIMDSKAIN